MSEANRRFPAKFPVLMRQGPEMFPAMMCNISRRGGCILGTHTLTKGDTIVLDYSIGQTRALVMWTMSKMAGLKFETEVTPQGMDCIRDLKTLA